MAEITQTSDSNNKQRKIRSRKRSTHIDMTPMVDLAFLLLTFFVMTTTLNKGFVMKVNMPEKPTDTSPATPIPEKQALTLILAKDNKIYWYQGRTDPKVEVTNFSKDGIRKVLIAKKLQIEKLYVLIKATDQSKYQNIIDILDEMDINGIEGYAMVDITAIDKELIALK